MSKLTSLIGACALLTLALSLAAGCTGHARLYDLQTGNVLQASFKRYGTGHGKITATTPEGTTLVGEYSTISGVGYSSAAGTASAAGSGGYAWATAQGFSFNQPGEQYGSAVLVGGGLVIDIVYVVDPWSGHGNGVGRDNRGGTYRVQF